MKLLRPADLKPLTLPHLFLPAETPLKASIHSPLHSLCFLADPGASSCGTAWCGVPPPLETMTNRLPFQWQSFPDVGLTDPQILY